MSLDAELLQRYVETHDERAFAGLVQQHLGMVYAAALRRTGGRRHLAEEIAQKVFADLARKAGSLRRHPSLTGWLHRSTRYAAIDAIRAESRRQKLNQTLAAMPESSPSPETAVEWESLRPVIDEAVDELKEVEREVMLLRFFEGLSFAEAGARLDLSENAARMRTERALEKLRTHLGRRGITSTTAALGLLLANQAFAAAPEGMAPGVTSAALSAAPAAGTGWLASALTGKAAASAAIVLGAAGLGVLGWKLADPGAGGEPVDGAMVRAADGFAGRAMAVYRTMERIHPTASDVPAGGTASSIPGIPPHDRRTPLAAQAGFARASRALDIPALALLLTFDAEGTVVARDIHAGMPETLRTGFRTPEELFAFFYATDTLLSPVPPAAFVEGFVATELKPGRVAIHRPGSPARGMEFVLTAGGWKHEVPTAYLRVLTARIVSGETLARLQRLAAARASAPAVEEGTARAALVSFAAACNRGDAVAAGGLLHFDPAAQEKALGFMAALPPEMRSKWRNPVELAADLLVDGAIANPYPAVAVLATATEERLDDHRVAWLLPDTIRPRLEFQQVSGAWKHVITEAMVDDYLRRMAAAATPR